MKFLTDAMLGKLTRILRIFGYDTIYAEDIGHSVSDENLLEYAVKNDRIIITKDYPFFKKAGKDRCVYLSGKGVYNYLKQLKKALRLNYNFNINNARCSICNSPLKRQRDKNIIEKQVKPETLKHFTKFYQCTNSKCGKIYWKGTHIDDILEKLKKVQNSEDQLNNNK